MIEKYNRPSDLREAINLKAENPRSVYLAGGTEVNRDAIHRGAPECAIDLREALPARISAEGGETLIGAMTTLQEIADSDRVPSALRDAAGFLPSRSVRNQATIGGAIGARRPDSYVLPALIALRATLTTSAGTLGTEEYLRQESDALIIEVCIPAPDGACIAVKESRSHQSLPVVNAAVSLRKGDAGRIAEARIVLGCVADRVLRLAEVEKHLTAGAPADRAAVEEAIRAAINPKGDILGSPEYKKHVNGGVVGGAVIRCLEDLS